MPFIIAFEGSAVSEHGYDCQNLLFGGVPESWDHIDIVREWPCPEKTAIYQANQYPIVVTNSSIENVCRFRPMSDEYIPKLFTMAFWDGEVRQTGPQGLKSSRPVYPLPLLYPTSWTEVLKTPLYKPPCVCNWEEIEAAVTGTASPISSFVMPASPPYIYNPPTVRRQKEIQAYSTG